MPVGAGLLCRLGRRSLEATTCLRRAALTLALVFTAGFSLFSHAADEGAALAAYHAGNYERAVTLARPLAAKDDPQAMDVLGLASEQGQGTARDLFTAVKWFAAAAHKANYAPAEYSLARMYLDGRGVRRNAAKAREWLLAAAAQDHAESKRLLAELDGKSPPAATAAAPATVASPAIVAKTTPAAVAIAGAAPVASAPAVAPVKEAAPAPAGAPAYFPAVASAAPAPASAQASAVAAASAAVSSPAAAAVNPTSSPGPVFAGTYRAGSARSAVAALQAAFTATTSMGPAAARPLLEPPLREAAMRFWEAEAVGEKQAMGDVAQVIQANGAAATGLARAFRNSPVAGDRAIAALLSTLTQSGGASADACAGYVAAAGTAHPPAQYHAALCAVQSAGGKSADDGKQALAWLRAAASAGHAGALETLGRACLEGSERNWDCASRYLAPAARAGRPTAMALYAWVLSNQPAARPADFAQAFAWYKKGAALGDVSAQNNIGEMYERGRGAPLDEKAAREWYRHAAEAGFGPGQFNYARLLLAGSGGAADRNGAIKWFQAADKNGVAQAKIALRQVAGTP
jgi:TPR repeat protein